MNPDDDIDANRVFPRALIEKAIDPTIPEGHVRINGALVSLAPNLMQLPRACRTVTNFFQQGDNANCWTLQTLDSHDGVIDSRPVTDTTIGWLGQFPQHCVDPPKED